VELQLRRELTCVQQGRSELERQCAELAGQLERTQAAYDAALTEVGSMSTRLHELEFGAKADTSLEDALRRQLGEARERCGDLEQRLTECAWMRDYALQQADDARTQLNARRTEAAEPSAPADGHVDGAVPQSADAASASAEARRAKEEACEVRAEMEQMAARHQEELKRQAQMSREEVEYFKRKNDEKDRRLEVLVCECNALRFESTEGRAGAAAQPAAKAPGARGSCGESDALPDLEDPPQGRNFRLADQGSAASAVGAVLAEGDVVLRRLARLLYLSPIARRAFYGYVAFLHVWIWVVLHRAAAAHSPHGV